MVVDDRDVDIIGLGLSNGGFARGTYRDDLKMRLVVKQLLEPYPHGRVIVHHQQAKIPTRRTYEAPAGGAVVLRFSSDIERGFFRLVVHVNEGAALMSKPQWGEDPIVCSNR